MSEAITTLREGLKAGLIAARTIAGDLVEAERRDPIYTAPRDAAGKLPKLCVYVVEDVATANANGTLWECTATIVIDSWDYAVSEAAGGRTAEEVAGARVDQLDGQAVRAIVNDRALMNRLGIARVTRSRTARTVGKPAGADIIYAASSTSLEVDLFDRAELCEGADLLEQVETDVGVADAGGATDMTITAQVPQEVP